jgi:hypothetical protein
LLDSERRLPLLHLFQFGAQLILESQEIVTSSLVLWLLNLVDENMETIVSNEHMDGLDHLSDISESLIELVEEMKTDFDKRWGDDLAGSPFKRQVTRGHKKRQVGVHPNLLKAHALDPRFLRILMLFKMMKTRSYMTRAWMIW